MSQRSQPIFVTGYKRSGTTLLGNVLDRHRRIAIFVESFFIPRYFYAQVAFWPLKRPDNLARLARSIADEGASRANHLELDESLLSSVEDPTLAGLLDAMLLEWARGRGKDAWGDKSPGYLSKLPILDRLFPRARFVHIVRDGRDVWLSLKRLGWETDVVHVAADWTRAVSRARRHGRALGNRYLEVRYEDLLRRQEEVAKAVASFVGEEFDPRMLEPDTNGPGNPALDGWPGVDEAINPENLEKWPRELSPREAALFELFAGDLLADLGYRSSGLELGPTERLRARGRAFVSRIRQLGRRIRRGARILRRALRRRVN